MSLFAQQLCQAYIRKDGIRRLIVFLYDRLSGTDSAALHQSRIKAYASESGPDAKTRILKEPVDMV